MKDLAHIINSSTWLLTPEYVDNYIPAALKILEGTYKGKVNPESTYTYGITPGNDNIRLEDNDNDIEDIVAVHEIRGLILKYGGLCDRGMQGFIKDLRKAEEDKNVSAHLLDIDSGGGQATNIETVARIVKSELQKPVMVFCNGMIASAAYYIASAADEIYLSEKTDMAGSIGTMMKWMDLTEYYENLGVKIHEVYADQSSDKNKDIREARQGSYDLLKENLLNPYAQQFIDTVKEFRPQVDQKVFTGDIYMAEKAQELGLIDGILKFSEVVQNARTAASTSATTFSNTKTITMQYTSIMSAIGTDALEIHDGHASFNEEQIEKIENELASANESQDKSDKSDEAVKNTDKILETINTVSQSMEAVNQKLNNLAERLDAQEELTVKLASEEAEESADAYSSSDIYKDVDEQVARATREAEKLNEEVNSNYNYSM